MSNKNLIYQLAEQAGIKIIPVLETIGGRGFLANHDELSKFAKLVADIARKDERKKMLTKSNKEL